MVKQAQISPRRSEFYQPFYNANKPPELLDIGSWPTSDNPNVEGKELAAISFPSAPPNTKRNLSATAGTAYIIRGSDITGKFEQGPYTVKGVTFEDCDFSLSEWTAVKFASCSFTRCSFSLATFKHSEFRRCRWRDMAISGNEMDLSSTVITNPRAFLSAAYTCIDAAKPREGKNTVLHQDMKRARTRVKVAKVLLHNLAATGEEKAYYAAVREMANYIIDAKVLATLYYAQHKSKGVQRICGYLTVPFFALEKVMVNGWGSVNAWGESMIRVMLFGIAVMAWFTVDYYLGADSHALGPALLRAANITLVAGYTNGIGSVDSAPTRATGMLNLCLGLFWYSVFIPTIVNRVSRVH